MFDLLLSRMVLRAVSALLGGIGVFSLFVGFTMPAFWAQAAVLIAAAAAIVHFCPE